MHDVPKPSLDSALSDLKSLLAINTKSDLVVARCRVKRIERIRGNNEAINSNVGYSSSYKYDYSIMLLPVD